MDLVYFSHSYRKEDTDAVKYFSSLMRSEGFLPSLDPPSKSVNASKLERHLLSSDGLVAVLSWRKEGVSKYILFEISLCLRAKKPLLVFVEDNLPDNIIPANILQRRFSRRSYLRQIREHRHALKILKSYIGDQPQPRYQPVATRKSCLIVGMVDIPDETSRLIPAWLETRGYNLIDFRSLSPFRFQDPEIFETLSTVDLALCNVDSASMQSEYMLGAIQASFIPSITFTTSVSYNYHPLIPMEFQPRMINLSNGDLFQQMLEAELELFEEDFIELGNQEEVETYTSLLIDIAPLKGHYELSTRQFFFKEIIMGDKISFGNVSGSIVTIGSMLEHLTQTVGSANNIDENGKKRLVALIEQLQMELQKLPPEKKEEAEAIADSAKTFVEAGTRAQPNKIILKTTSEGLKSAARNIGGVLPTVLTIATAIVKTVLELRGIHLP